MSDWLTLDVDPELWERVFVVSPLVLVGTREPDGSFDLAPKHRIVTLPGHLLGRIVAAHADRKALRRRDVPDGTLVYEQPLLAYLHPSQFALIEHSAGFPFPKDFHRE